MFCTLIGMISSIRRKVSSAYARVTEQVAKEANASLVAIAGFRVVWDAAVGMRGLFRVIEKTVDETITHVFFLSKTYPGNEQLRAVAKEEVWLQGS